VDTGLVGDLGDSAVPHAELGPEANQELVLLEIALKETPKLLKAATPVQTTTVLTPSGQNGQHARLLAEGADSPEQGRIPVMKVNTRCKTATHRFAAENFHGQNGVLALSPVIRESKPDQDRISVTTFQMNQKIESVMQVTACIFHGTIGDNAHRLASAERGQGLVLTHAW